MKRAPQDIAVSIVSGALQVVGVVIAAVVILSWMAIEPIVYSRRLAAVRRWWTGGSNGR